MKQFIATILLVGYIALVPFCFFGGMLVANADTMNMSGGIAHQMDDCGMPIAGCYHTMQAGGIDTAVHHISMYLSITQTPLAGFSLMIAIMVVLLLLTLGVFQYWLRVFFARTSPRIHLRRVDEPHLSTELRILSWLSLFETSPNFA